MNGTWRLRTVLAVAVVGISSSALARDPFELAINLDGDADVEAQLGFAGIEEAIDQLDFEALADRTGYNGDQSVFTDFNLRGLQGDLDFATAGNGDLTFSIPGINFNQGMDNIVFEPRNRQASVAEQRRDTLEQLKDYLKENGDALKALLTAFARFSPIDPLAGNPGSLFSTFQARDFNNGFMHKVSQIYGCGTSAFNMNNDEPFQVAVVGGVSDIFADAQARAAALQGENEFGIGAQYLNTTASTPTGDFKSSTISVPISYTWKFDANPSHKLRIDLPLTATDAEGAAAYSLGLGLAYTYPISDVWTLTPAAGVGATGSEDLGSAGGVSAYSLTSAYTWRLGGFALSMGNSIGQYDSLPLKIGDIEAEADVSNQVFTNGFLLSGPNSLIANNLVIEYSFIDTRITGDDVYSEYYDEIGVAVGHINTEQGIITSYLKGGLSYLMADNEIDGFKLSLSARF